MSKKIRFTPGPWSSLRMELETAPGGIVYRIGEGEAGPIVATVWADDSGNEAGDALLISKAPDLLLLAKMYREELGKEGLLNLGLEELLKELSVLEEAKA